MVPSMEAACVFYLAQTVIELMENSTMRTFSRSNFIRFGLLSLFSLLAASLCNRVKAGSMSETKVKASRLKTLSKGINMGPLQKNGLVAEATLQEYKNLGLTYTRIFIKLPEFFDDNNPSVLKTDSLNILDELIKTHVKTGVGITVSPTDSPPELYSNPDTVVKFVAFFKAFATHLSSTNPEIVFLEVMNEPNAPTVQDWNKVQHQLISAIRSQAPNHTIIASSSVSLSTNDWNELGAFPMTQVVADKNVVYNFHCYEPIVFTHQGATWGWSGSKFIKDIPYPSTPEVVAPLLDTIQDAEAKVAVEKYGKERWNRNKYVSILSPIANWAKTNRVHVICNEFGAIFWTAPRNSRLRYLKDIREVFDSYGIGWAEYFVDSDVHDNEALRALDLKPSIHV